MKIYNIFINYTFGIGVLHSILDKCNKIWKKYKKNE